MLGVLARRSNSFDFTSWWADTTNRPIQDLAGFARTFFAKHTILNLLTKYCVLTADRMLLAMRPYQIVATEQILQPDRSSPPSSRAIDLWPRGLWRRRWRETLAGFEQRLAAEPKLSERGPHHRAKDPDCRRCRVRPLPKELRIADA